MTTTIAIIEGLINAGLFILGRWLGYRKGHRDGYHLSRGWTK